MEHFRNADWKRIQLGLCQYAVYKVQRLHWKTSQGLPKGLLPEDIALGAIRKTLEGLSLREGEEASRGVRHWDPDKEPNLLEFLKSVVDSDVSALVNSDEHRLNNYSANVEPDKAGELFERSVEEDRRERGLGHESAESLILDRESAADIQGVFDRLMGALRADCANDPDEMAVLHAYEELAETEDNVKPAMIAKHTGLEEERVRNARRRIERKTRSIRARFQTPAYGIEPDGGGQHD